MASMRIDLGVKALRECESRLRALVAEAVDAADYDAVLRLADWARTVSDLQSAQLNVIPNRRDDTSKHGGTRTLIELVDRSGPTAKTQRRNRRFAPEARRRRPTGPNDYPKFFRFNDELVKIGWSKKERTEYQHKAPHRAVEALVNRLAEVGSAGTLFSAEQLFPLYEIDGDVEIPAYQVYLCLAWLRHVGLVARIGRQGYEIADWSDLRATVDRRWSGLICDRLK
jgi:hypothetical protein